MKHFGKFLAVVALLAIAVAAHAEVPLAPGETALYIRTYKAALANGGYVDSLATTQNGALQAVDTTTTFVVPITRRLTDAPLTAINTAFSIGKLFVYSSTAPTSVDTAFVAWDVSENGTDWQCGTFQNVLYQNASDKIAALPLLFDGDAATTALGSAYAWKYWRFRLRPDGNTASLAPATRLKLKLHL